MSQTSGAHAALAPGAGIHKQWLAAPIQLQERRASAQDPGKNPAVHHWQFFNCADSRRQSAGCRLLNKGCLMHVSELAFAVMREVVWVAV
ncbi:hypothetical protein BK671_23010 [Pseudomonas fluorescens]|uniref:Uncharacterized protein n=1 Tax=Pseudomonas fluorescens TaxID=294 RepID=A0A423L4L2_PSEFL|nr:hypothetical protein BK671_23010 [Pseudomonas fluorescens]